MSISSLSIKNFDCIFIQLTPELTIKKFNHDAESIYGFTQETALNQNFIQLCHTIHVEPPLQDFSSILSGKSVEKVIQTLSINHFLMKIQWFITPLVDSENTAKITSILIIGIDANLRLDREHMAKKEAYVEHILNNVPHSLFWKDKNSVFMGCNERFAKLAMLKSASEIIGKTDYDLPWSKQESDAYIADDQYVMQSKEAKLNIEESQTVNGKQIVLLTSKVPIYDDKKEVAGVLGIFTDITERKKSEEELREAKEKAEIASKTKTEFLENMRHDIRTPLLGIVGFADIIKKEITDPKIKEYADNLVASSYSLLDLLNSVLEAIKVSSGEIPLLKKKFDLQKKLNEVILLNQAKASQKNIQLLFEYDATIPTYLIGDPVRIHRVALEFVTNALNFTHKGRVKLITKLAKDNENDVIVKIIVEDTGIGIPLEKQQEIYVQFKRLTPSYEGIYKGSGLGLSIAKQLANDLEGEIYVESQIDAGSTFTFVLKLKKPLLDEALGSEELLPSFTSSKFISPIEVKPSEHIFTNDTTEAESYKSRILLVEDSPFAARLVAIMLSEMDCIVDIANNGKTAAQLAEENQYDLIFMDIGLPDIDGYETTKRIRSNKLKEKHVPIIALTAHAGEDNKQECISVGMNAVLTKPLQSEQAKDILNSFIPCRKNRLKTKTLDVQEGKSEKVEAKVVDFEWLERQYSNSKAIKDTLTMLVDSFPRELDALSDAYEANNWSLIQNLAHKLKGEASYCGAMRLQAVCVQLQSAVKEEKNELFESLYFQLLDEIELANQTILNKLAN